MDYRISRNRMVDRQLRARGIISERVIQAMRKVPRHYFVDEALRHKAYSDSPLPIGEGQTISQPYTVACMIQAMEVDSGDTVLEIGAGSGYQTALLAEIACKVFSLERIPSLLNRARKVLDRLGYLNVVLWQSDGTRGWKEYAPYDAIVVSASAPEIPWPLLAQLADGGRLVLPVGRDHTQTLVKVVRQGDDFHRTELGNCRFVKLMGQFGWSE